MASPVDIKVDTSGLDALAKQFDATAQQTRRAMRSALNSTLTNIQTEARRIIRKRYTYAGKNSVRSRKKHATEMRLGAFIEFSGGVGAGLRHFAPRPATAPDWKGVPVAKRRPAAGVSVQIKRGGRRYVVTGQNGEKPFWATGKQGFPALFYRKRGQPSKLRMLFGPSAIQALGRSAEEPLSQAANDALQKNMARALRAVTKGYLR